MMRISPEHRDLISVILLLLILLAAFPLLGSWFSDRVTTGGKPTPTATTAPDISTPTPEPTKESHAEEIELQVAVTAGIPKVDLTPPSLHSELTGTIKEGAPQFAVLPL